MGGALRDGWVGICGRGGGGAYLRCTHKHMHTQHTHSRSHIHTPPHIPAYRTVAANEGAIEYLAATAGLQQWKQAALAYTLLARAGRPLAQVRGGVGVQWGGWGVGGLGWGASSGRGLGALRVVRRSVGLVWPRGGGKGVALRLWGWRIRREEGHCRS